MESIHTNQKAEMILQFGGQLLSLICKVIEVQQTFLKLELVEINDDSSIQIPINQQIEVNLYSSDGVLIIKSTVLNHQENSITIAYPAKKKKIQRRDYFRIGLRTKVQLFFNDGEDDIYIEGYTIDLSAGGVRVVTDYPLESETVVEMRLHIEKYIDMDIPMTCKARVLSSKTHQSVLSNISAEISCLEFLDLGHFARKQLMQCCIKLQLDARRRGLI